MAISPALLESRTCTLSVDPQEASAAQTLLQQQQQQQHKQRSTIVSANLNRPGGSRRDLSSCTCCCTQATESMASVAMDTRPIHMMRSNRHHLNALHSQTAANVAIFRPSQDPTRMALTIPRASAASSNAPDPMEAPNLIFPDATWAFQKAPAKTSLADFGQEETATPWSLSWIEAIHWLSFAIGFYVAGFVVANASELLEKMPLGGDPWRLYLIVLGHLTQVFGGGITGNMMHTYEGWQVAPFRNPLTLPEEINKCKQGAISTANDTSQCIEGKAAKLFISSYNNAWLRSVAYQLLFMFQAVGICFSSMAAYGINKWTVSWLAVTIFVGIVGPKLPRMESTGFNKQPISPLPWALFVVFLLNLFINIPATVMLYGPAVVSAWPPTIPWWGAMGGAALYACILGSFSWIPAGAVVGLVLFGAANAIPNPATGCWVCLLKCLALLAPLGVGAGGMIEGIVAESTFNQWWHWRAFVVLLTGFGLYGLLYWHLLH